MSYRVLTLSLLALLALRPSIVEAQLRLDTFNMSLAVENLAGKFRQLATEGLGIDALKVS